MMAISLIEIEMFKLINCDNVIGEPQTVHLSYHRVSIFYEIQFKRSFINNNETNER